VIRRTHSSTQSRRSQGAAIGVAIAAALVVAATTVVVGHGVGASAPPSDVDCTEGSDDTLRLAAQEAPDPFDPATLSGNRSIELAQNVYNGLTAIDPATAEVIPALAESWEISDDGLEYTFTIRSGVTFHSGKPLTAADIAFSLNRAVDPDVRSEYAFFLGVIDGFDAVSDGTAETLSGVEAVDDSTLVIRLSRPAGYLPSLLTLWPYWAVDGESIEANGDDWVNPPNVNGTGSYRLVGQTVDAEYVFQANPDFWGGAPAIDCVVVTVVPESATALARYEAGELDVIRNLSPASYRLVLDDPELSEQLGTASLLRTTWLNMRNDQPPFDDPAVRQAFNLAVDRDAIVEIALGGLGTPASTFLPPGLPGNLAADRPAIGVDPEEAQRILAEAGFPDGEGFPATTLYYNSRDDFQAVAELVQAQLSANLGIDIELAPTPGPAYNDLLNDPEARPAFSMYSFGLDYPDPQEMQEYLVQSQPNGFANYGNFSNPEVDALITQANATNDPAERYALASQVETIFLDSWAVVPLYHPLATWLARPEVVGFEVNALYMTRWENISLS
jgi:ABC-type transport system substrate-binding protein